MASRGVNSGGDVAAGAYGRRRHLLSSAEDNGDIEHGVSVAQRNKQPFFANIYRDV